MLTPMMHFMISIGIAGVIWYGSYLITTGQLTPGGFVSFITALLMLYHPIKSIGSNFTNVQMSLLAMERVFGVLDKQPCVTNSTGWYIPTLGQWAEILNFVGGAGIHTYNNRLSYSLDHTESGFVKYGFSTSYYWTSNLRDTRTVWALYLGKDDSQNDYLNKTEYAKIRAVAAF